MASSPVFSVGDEVRLKLRPNDDDTVYRVGAVVEASGVWCYFVADGYAAGMWRLASELVRETPDSGAL